MCVIFFYANSNPEPGGYKLILASNRDEFYARETLGAAKWANAEHVYGGIDLEPGREGGTWLAVGGHKGIFKVGALLNLTGEPKLRNAIGRGMIVTDFVKSCDGEHSIDDYNRSLVSDCSKYNAFNFISIEIGASIKPACITVCSNAPAGLTNYAERQCYGFGNSLPSAPFEKVRYGQQRFQVIVDSFHSQNMNTEGTTRQHLVKQCMDLLKCKHKFWPDAELQRRAPTWGHELSALNVNVPNAGYGSRTHSVILIDSKNKLHFYEETMIGMDSEGPWKATHIEKQYFEN